MSGQYKLTALRDPKDDPFTGHHSDKRLVHVQSIFEQFAIGTGMDLHMNQTQFQKLCETLGLINNEICDRCAIPGLMYTSLCLVTCTGVFGLGFHTFRVLYAKRTSVHWLMSRFLVEDVHG